VCINTSAPLSCFQGQFPVEIRFVTHVQPHVISVKGRPAPASKITSARPNQLTRTLVKHEGWGRKLCSSWLDRGHTQTAHNATHLLFASPALFAALDTQVTSFRRLPFMIRDLTACYARRSLHKTRRIIKCVIFLSTNCVCPGRVIDPAVRIAQHPKSSVSTTR
jgi:hypothetical protein